MQMMRSTENRNVCILHFAFCISLFAAASPARAQVSLVGDWSSRIHEDSTRNDPRIGDFAGLPLTPQALAHADTWTESRLTLIERQCVPNGAAWAFRGPAQIRIWEEKDPTTQDVVAIKTFIATFSQTRTIWMDGRPHPGKYAPHTWQGFSTGTWQGSMLTVKTTHLKRFFHRRNGVPQSDQATMTESFIRHGTNYLTHVTMTEDPVYLTEPLVQSQNFVLVANVTPATYQAWTVCLAQEEIAGRARGFVPHYLPGTNPYIREYSTKFNLPFEATRAGAEAMYPESRNRLAQVRLGPGQNPTIPAPGRTGPEPDVATVQVAPDVYMIGGSGGNVTVNVGPNGLFVVDAGGGAGGAKVAAAIRAISDKPIRYLANTSADADHVGGNVAVKALGQAIRTRENREEGAVIIAHEAVLNRMSAPTGQESPTPVAAWPTSTFATPQQDLAFNGQAIQLFRLPAAHTDGDTVVFFRRSDVVATGDVFDPSRYPVIDLAKGGSINGEIDAINWLLDLLVPGEKEEGGSMVVPGHGRVCDESEVMEYRDMLTIVRDRVKAMVDKGMTLEQVKAAKPTFEYDPEYGASEAFVEAVFRGLQVRP
jgi:glyoxylase-like metal-dependent hydrolase (beta-lactamase superfamily II)